MQTIDRINSMIGALFLICLSYQLLFMILPFFKKYRPDGADSSRRYAVLLAARNEEAVLPALIGSIRAQRYPRDKLRIFVVADNCTDSTADAARRAGAEVLERSDPQRPGKGFALDWLIQALDERGEIFDGYFIFDADNLLDENFVAEMNRLFCSGYEIITGCRCSKNFGDNWISAAYSLWFLRDSQFMNRSRMLLGTSAFVAGTGFLLSRGVLERCGGWKFHLLSEDTEFTAWSILHGEEIAYCETAVFYDEQPTEFGQSCRQRMRWVRGYLQVFRRYGLSLLGSMLRGSFASFDLVMCTMPAIVLTIAACIFNAAGLLTALTRHGDVTGILRAGVLGVVQGYLSFFLLGAFTAAAERRHIRCPSGKILCALFTFPLFMFTYIPVSIAAVFGKACWQPIRHSAAVSLQELAEGKEFRR